MTTEPQAHTSERERLLDGLISAARNCAVAECVQDGSIYALRQKLIAARESCAEYARADAAQILDLQAKLAAREADAERYLCLRDGGCEDFNGHLFRGKQLDRVVDATIAATHAPRSKHQPVR